MKVILRANIKHFQENVYCFLSILFHCKMCSFHLNQTPIGIKTFVMEFFICLGALTFPYYDLLTPPCNFPVQNLRKDKRILKIYSKFKIQTQVRWVTLTETITINDLPCDLRLYFPIWTNLTYCVLLTLIIFHMVGKSRYFSCFLKLKFI